MQCYWLMMKIKNTLCLHFLMAFLAILFLCIHPLVASFDPPLTFQPLIKSMAGTPKEGANKQVISSQADSLIKISRIWADFFPANTSNQPI
ncbi:hypothetical protein STW0522ENT66_14380 [Enterobacter roggenkampii]|nr:hypothetical protein STW0522ENT66_14380 [Enterobacter roggenkampii]